MATKKCKKCGEVKPLNEFHKEKRSKDGHNTKCKRCRSKQRKQHYEDNKDKVKEQQAKYRKTHKEEILKKQKEYRDNTKEQAKQYYKNNKGWILERTKQYYKNNKNKIQKQMKQYYKNNKEQFKINNQKRRTIEKALEHTLTKEQWTETLEHFNYSGALTGSDDIHLEHFIPLSSGHGGTCIENCYPMNSTLNLSKNDSNPFEWIKIQPEDIQDNFYNVLVPYLADKNNMSVDEFTAYVNYCMEHKRTVEQIKVDNEAGITSKDLFYKYINEQQVS